VEVNPMNLQAVRNPNSRSEGRVLKLVQLAILSALTIIMSLTPLGYLPLGPVIRISFLMIPVVIGAIVIGPAGGAFLGFVFGLTSFMTCVTGTDAFGALIFQLNPAGAFLVTIPTRVLAGFLPGLFAYTLKNKLKSVVLYPITALIGSLCNTVFFLGVLLLIFGQSAAVAEALGSSVLTFVITTVLSVNALLEAITCTVVGATLSGAISRITKR
jgi:uncharacterized membrane protein